MTRKTRVPESRIRTLWDEPVRTGGSYVLYWMTACRRPRFNYGLDRAIHLAREVRKPLLVLEALRIDYRWASDRIHQFILQGMRANQASFGKAPITYFPYVERSKGQGKGLLAALAHEACAVITDDTPAFFLPRMLASARLDVSVRFEAIDSNGLMPVRATSRAFSRAVDFRRYWHGNVIEHLSALPSREPLRALELPRL
ncbi:MAG: deoxyribodipyrimidine photo-lyase, partial [Planctomycetota bacterium]